jgi:hypothetical protein
VGTVAGEGQLGLLEEAGAGSVEADRFPAEEDTRWRVLLHPFCTAVRLRAVK